MNVGPGQYSPEYGYGKDKSPSFRYFMVYSSMRAKQGQSTERFPGPGTY